MNEIIDNTKMLFCDCPFCKTKHTYYYDNAKEVYGCLSCGIKDSKITYAFKNTGQYPEFTPIVIEASKNQQDIYYINQIANDYFCKAYKKNKEAKKYVEEVRGLREETILRSDIGYDDGKLVSYLVTQGFSEELIALAGLSNGPFDAFQGRITIPIMDNVGRILGFGARLLNDGKPKYINTKDTLVFNKSAVFYGIDKINWSLPYIILCEGYMDVISMQQAGIENCVATMGTSLTTAHISLIKEMGKMVYVMYDSDEAGMQASLKNMGNLEKYLIQTKWVNISPFKDADEFLKNKSIEELIIRFHNATDKMDCFMHSCEITKNLSMFCQIVSELDIQKERQKLLQKT